MEDIKILEEYLRIYKEINEKYDNYFVSIKEIPIQAIENLLKRYKELEEENKNARNEIIKIINTPEAIKNSINELRTNQFI